MAKARKTFAQYAAERAKQARAEEPVAVAMSDAACAQHSVGATLTRARKARHLSQVELAERAGVDQGDISRIELGLIAPTAPTLLKLVKALGARLTLTVPVEPTAGDEGDAESEPLLLDIG
jgi:ribosome-binding protein aMBF1 (putative translation factor)